MKALLIALVLTGCGAGAEFTNADWKVTSYREQFAWTDPPPGCLRVCVTQGEGCAMLGPNGEHQRCAEGENPMWADDGSFGTCVVSAEPCSL